MSLDQELNIRLGYLKGRRNNHENTWQEINDLMQPFRGDITTKKSPGGKRIGSVFDTTAMNAADSFVNFLKSAVLPSSSELHDSVLNEVALLDACLTVRDDLSLYFYLNYG